MMRRDEMRCEAKTMTMMMMMVWPLDCEERRSQGAAIQPTYSLMWPLSFMAAGKWRLKMENMKPN